MEKSRRFKKNFGWVHKSLISGNRTGIVLSKDNKNIDLFNTLDGDVIGEIGNGNIVNLEIIKRKRNISLFLRFTN